MDTAPEAASTVGGPSAEVEVEVEGGWARHGHADATVLTPVFQAHPEQVTPVAGQASRFSRGTRGAVGTVLLAVAALGSGGAAVAFGEAVFPTAGDAKTWSVWQNPGLDHQSSPPATVASTTTAKVSSTFVVPPTFQPQPEALDDSAIDESANDGIDDNTHDNDGLHDSDVIDHNDAIEDDLDVDDRYDVEADDDDGG